MKSTLRFRGSRWVGYAISDHWYEEARAKIPWGFLAFRTVTQHNEMIN